MSKLNETQEKLYSNSNQDEQQSFSSNKGSLFKTIMESILVVNVAKRIGISPLWHIEQKIICRMSLRGGLTIIQFH